MKALVLSSIFGMALLFASAADDPRERYTIGSGKLVSVKLDPGGEITVEGHGGDDAVLAFRTRADLDDYDIKVSENQDGLTIHVRHTHRGGNRGLNLHLKVPHHTNLKLHSNGGAIRLTDLEGEFNGKTMGGEIKIRDLSGKIQLKTMGGNIDVKDSDLDGRVTTMGGNIRFTDVSGSVDGKTMGGNVIMDRVKLDKTSADGTPGEPVEITTMGGNIKVDDAPNGAKVKTMGGTIRIGHALEYAQANTMGGNIHIDSVDGWVKATTMGGDVKVVMVGDPDEGKRDVDITSMSGDIELTLPSGIDIDIDVELAYTKNSSGNYAIHSDFPLNINESDKWSYGRGSARKVIRGTGKVGSATHKVRIETVNGNVTIKAGR